ncbi:MAG TPA: DUF1294 domain-containing protein [Cellvibrionaceae bacterium]|nr:DUF1294 domain-containing protein [Cellvibrionaceae bacterium]
MTAQVFAGLFLTLLAVLVAGGFLSVWVLLVYGVLSTMTYGLYAWDKNAAVQGNWRIAENNMQLIALLGGWPGALIAQQQLRHKSKKFSFKCVLWASIVINLALFAAFSGRLFVAFSGWLLDAFSG